MIYTSKTISSSDDIYTEATGFEKFHRVSPDKVPEEFKKVALKLYDTIKEEYGDVVRNILSTNAASAKDIGELMSKTFNNDKRREDIANEDVKAHYQIYIKSNFELFGAFRGLSKKYKAIIDNSLSKAGFKKGQSVAKGYYGNYYYIKSKDKDKNDCYFLAYGAQAGNGGAAGIQSSDTIQFVLHCVKEEDKSFIESACGFGHCEDELEPNSDGFEGLTPEKLFGIKSDAQGLARSEELTKSSYSDFFRDPKIMETFSEHFDLTDRTTRRAIISMNEADQHSVLTALTSKLYDNIVTKVDDIDYGDIPNSKGDITKVEKYEKMRECIDLLRQILEELKQDTAPINVLSEALSNVSVRKELFERAFRYDCELPIIMYNTTVLSIISGISLMIASCIEFIKVPNQDTFEISLDKVAYAKTKNNMLYNNLKKFNKICSNGEFDKAMEHVIQNRLKGISESAATILTTAAIVGGVIAIIANIIPILRELVFFFYYTRMRVSDFFDIQADLLQMNVYNLQNNNSLDDEKKERTISKQLKIVDLFRKISNKISFSLKKAEVDATKEITASSKKMKLDDVVDELPDSASSSALF